jgi:hypothetical protein
MSSAYITYIPKDDKVKVNNISTSRPLSFSGSAVTVTDDPNNDTIDIAISSSVGGVSKGVKSLSGDGNTKVFTFTHGVSPTPTTAFIQANSNDARGNYIVSVDSTNITVTYAFPPPSGSGNISLYWIVS